MKSLIAVALFAALLCGVVPQETQSQNLPPTTTGKSYLIAFPKPLENAFDVRFPNNTMREDHLVLLLYADHSTTVVITSPDGSSSTTTVTGGEFKEVALPVTASSYIDQTGVVSDNAYKVRSQRPILLYCYMAGRFGAESWTPLPIESWGNEYYASAIPSEEVVDIMPRGEFDLPTEAKNAPSQIIITAARNNTTVLIEPNDEVAGSGLNPITITLDAGESYMIRSGTDSGNPGSHDLGGTRIVSNKLIGVITGNTRASALEEYTMVTGNSIKNLMVEALAPVEQHGTEFVFMPTWDDRRQRPGLDTNEDRDHEYTRVYGSSAGTTFGTITDDQGNLNQFSMTNADFHSAQFSAPVAHLIRTDQPAQAMMHSSAIVKYNGTTTWGQNYIGASYLSWSPYMVELTPREQWTKAAAFICPRNRPSSMTHYVNLVTHADDASNVYFHQGSTPRQRFLFNRGTIPGTDLVWGTMQINPGVTYFLEGDDGGRFAGFVYGKWRGQEQYRPGAAKRDDDKGNSPQAMHPLEYEENNALSYAYPISPRRRVLNDPDILTIRSEDEEIEVDGEKYFRISISNDNASGIRSVDLGPESINTEIEVLDLQDETELVGMTEAFVKLRPIDPAQDASATLIVTDRTGNETSAAYEYSTEISGVTGPGRIVSRVEIVGPNPTAGSTAIMLALARGGEVRVTITNALGQQVATLADRSLTAGEHLLEWDASAMSAGVYFCTVTSAGTTTIERIIVQ